MILKYIYEMAMLLKYIHDSTKFKQKILIQERFQLLYFNLIACLKGCTVQLIILHTNSTKLFEKPIDKFVVSSCKNDRRPEPDLSKFWSVCNRTANLNSKK